MTPIQQAVTEAVTMLSTLPYAPTAAETLKATARLWAAEIEAEGYEPGQVRCAARHLVRTRDSWVPLAVMLRQCRSERAADTDRRIAERHRVMIEVEKHGVAISVSRSDLDAYLRDGYEVTRQGAIQAGRLGVEVPLPLPLSDEERESKLRRLQGRPGMPGVELRLEAGDD